MINQHAKLEDLEDKAEDMRSAARPHVHRGARPLSSRPTGASYQLIVLRVMIWAGGGVWWGAVGGVGTGGAAGRTEASKFKKNATQLASRMWWQVLRPPRHI
jgi:hypothetical protein